MVVLVLGGIVALGAFLAILVNQPLSNTEIAAVLGLVAEWWAFLYLAAFTKRFGSALPMFGLTVLSAA